MVRFGLCCIGSAVRATVRREGDVGVAPLARCVACAVHVESEFKRRGGGAGGPTDGTAAAHEGDITLMNVVRAMPAALPEPFWLPY